MWPHSPGSVSTQIWPWDPVCPRYPPCGARTADVAVSVVVSGSGVAQWSACWAHNPKVPGPKPGSAKCRPEKARSQKRPSGRARRLRHCRLSYVTDACGHILRVTCQLKSGRGTQFVPDSPPCGARTVDRVVSVLFPLAPRHRQLLGRVLGHRARTQKSDAQLLEMGLEPTISSLGGRGLIHYTTRARVNSSWAVSFPLAPRHRQLLGRVLGHRARAQKSDAQLLEMGLGGQKRSGALDMA